MNLVAVKTKATSSISEMGRWFEVIPPENIYPKNIHESQLDRRLRR
jgi:hypothetical protein